MASPTGGLVSAVIDSPPRCLRISCISFEEQWGHALRPWRFQIRQTRRRSIGTQHHLSRVQWRASGSRSRLRGSEVIGLRPFAHGRRTRPLRGRCITCRDCLVRSRHGPDPQPARMTLCANFRPFFCSVLVLASCKGPLGSCLEDETARSYDSYVTCFDTRRRNCDGENHRTCRN